jgi:hypothetical protein
MHQLAAPTKENSSNYSTTKTENPFFHSAGKAYFSELPE